MGMPWGFRVLPALGTIGLIVLWLLACSGSIQYMVESFFGLPLGGSNTPSNHSPINAFFEFLLSAYITALHLLAVGFPLRASWAVVIMTWEIACARICCEQRRKNLMFTETNPSERGVLHAILMPNYKEDIDTLQDTLDVLADADWAKSNVDIWLAKEEKDPEAKSSAVSLEATYQNSFRSIQSTFHPAGLPGEAQGKSSNVSWAANQAMKKYEREDLNNKDVIFTVIDADTNLSRDYFMLVNEMHTSSRKGDRDISMYVPPVIFDRNAHKVPLFVRLADLMWTGASLSGTYPGSAVCIPTSVYSLPMALAKSVGGWDTGAEAIGEDMHMYLKCFMHTHGDLITRPVPSAASHCNISSSKQGFRGYLDGISSRWAQGLRHMWGSLDTGYAYRRAPAALFRKNAHNPTDQARPFTFKKMRRIVLLFSRLFEAHCLPVQLTLSLLASAIFEAWIPKIITPAPMRMAFYACGIMRPVSFVLMIFYFTLYRRYHSLCLKIRVEDSTRIGNHSDFSNGASAAWYWIECLIFPIPGTLYGTIAGVYAQTSQLFTDKLVYVVSLKPLRQLGKSQASSSSF